MRLSRRIIFQSLLFVVIVIPVLRAQSLPSANSEKGGEDIRNFTQKIAALAAPSHAIHLLLRNSSSLSAPEFSSFEDRLRTELSLRGLQMVADSASTAVTVTFSENVDGFLWVAEVGDGADRKVTIIAPTRGLAVETSSHSIPLLRKALLLAQREPILDFDVLPALPSGKLLLLEPEQVVIMQKTINGWILSGNSPIPHSHPWPRDLRGHIVLSAADQFETFMPGVYCVGNSNPALNTACEESTDSWALAKLRLSFVAGRNYLSASSAEAKGTSIDLPLSYSFAILDPNSDSYRAVSIGLDGNARLLGNANSTPLASAHWGDDIASIAPACGADRDIMASAPGDWTQRDHLQAYEIVNSDTLPVGDPIEFPGPIMSLWPTQDGNSIRAVSRNLETGMYEASIISMSCGN